METVKQTKMISSPTKSAEEAPSTPGFAEIMEDLILEKISLSLKKTGKMSTICLSYSKDHVINVGHGWSQSSIFNIGNRFSVVFINLGPDA